ncbi:MAG: DUF1292 domain-containing protein [Clostridia bacterium]|nr:DUF1292 domain-containing protein [Clostridia bacterium]
MADEENVVDQELPESMEHMEEDDDDVVTLLSADGEEIDFVEIAGIAYKGSFYAILQPVELLDGMDDDEALVFKVTRGKDGEDKFEIELDDSVIDAVFAEYNRLLDEAEGAGSNE